MNQLTYIISNTVYLFLGLLQLLMFVRAILSWLPIDDDNPLSVFVYQVTEVVIFPVRSLLERSETIASMPLDLSFFVTYILLSVVQMLLV